MGEGTQRPSVCWQCSVSWSGCWLHACVLFVKMRLSLFKGKDNIFCTFLLSVSWAQGSHWYAIQKLNKSTCKCHCFWKLVSSATQCLCFSNCKSWPIYRRGNQLIAHYLSGMHIKTFWWGRLKFHCLGHNSDQLNQTLQE